MTVHGSERGVYHKREVDMIGRKREDGTGEGESYNLQREMS